MASTNKSRVDNAKTLTKEDLRPFFRALRRALIMVARAIEQLYPDGLEA